MSDIDWALPASLALLGALVVAGVIVLIVRARQRSPRAAAAAAEARSAAEASLMRLDDAATGLDIAFDASDVLGDEEVPTDLRRARAAALRGRDRGFTEVAALATSTRLPSQRRTDAVRVRDDLERRIAAVADARERLTAWTAAHGSTAARLEAARARRDEIARTSGDPARLVAGARARFDDVEWTDADRADREARAALERADTALAAAAAAVDDPAVADARILAATADLRRTGRMLRAIEDAHRITLQAAENGAGEVTAARFEIATAQEIAAARPADCAPDAAERLTAAAAELEAAADALDRRPRAAIETVARIREERDAVLREAPSPRRRLEAARAALPGTLACARAAVAAAEAFADEPPIEVRLRLDAARRDLAHARAAQDAHQALAAARAAWSAVAPRGRDGALS